MNFLALALVCINGIIFVASEEYGYGIIMSLFLLIGLLTIGRR